MNRNDPTTVSMFSAARRVRSFGLVLAGAICVVLALGGSGAIVRDFVTAGAFASTASAPTQHAG